MKKDTLIIYGAVAQPPVPPGNTWEASKHRLRRIADRLIFGTLKHRRVNYRNYSSKHIYNRGDYAIIQASTQAIKACNQHLELRPINWEEINRPENSNIPFSICGSGYFSLNSKQQLSTRLRSDLSWIKRGNSPSMIYGSGVNLIDPRLMYEGINLPPAGADFLCDFLSHCKHISVRDATSQNLLQEHTSNQVHLISDPALFIEPNNRKSPEKTFSDQRIHIGINFPFHGPGASARINEDLRSYVIALKEIQIKTDCLFHYMIHYDSELLVAALLRDAGIKLRVVHGDVDDLLHAYRQLNIHIGGMLHSCILASSTGTPAIGLAYDIKHSGFFSLLGFPEHCIPAQPFVPDRIVSLALQTLNKERQLRTSILMRRSDLRQKADGFLRSALQQFNQ